MAAEEAKVAMEPVATPKSAEMVEVESAPMEIEPTSSEMSSKETSSPTETPKDTNKYPRKDSLEVHRSRSLGRIMQWSLGTYFDFNPAYFLQLRGIMNVLHLIVSLIIVILSGKACRMFGNDHKTSDFFCKSPETFLFVTACSSFLTSVLYFFCCLLSKRSESLLFHTTLEVSYFILYAVLYIIASSCVMISGDRSDFEFVSRTSYDFRFTFAAGVLGLLNGIFYCGSAIAFFITHRFQNTNDAKDSDEKI